METEVIEFRWSREHGDCYGCGLPAAFTSSDAKMSPENLRCAVCAANDAADGCRIRRVDADPEPMIETDDAGLLTCPSCGGHAFKENGSHPCDWSFYDQDAEGKALVLSGDFEWYDGETDGFECEGCGFVGNLPDDWTTDYAG